MDPWKPNQEDDDLALHLRQGIMSILNEDDEINYNSAFTPWRGTGRYVAPIPPRNGDIDWSFPPNPSSSEQVAEDWSYAPPRIPESTNSTYLQAPYIPSDVASTSLGHQHGGLNFGYEINGWHYGPNLIGTPSHATLSPSLEYFYVPSHPNPFRLCSGHEIGSSSQSVGSFLNPISYNCLEDLTQRLSNNRISVPTQRSIPANIGSNVNVNVNVYEQLRNLETNYNTIAVGHAFDEVEEDIPHAMMDLQGSKLMESLIEMVSEEQRLTIVMKLTSNNL